MIYTAHYTSPLGGITLASDGIALTGLYFDGERDFPDLSPGRKKDLPLFGEVTDNFSYPCHAFIIQSTGRLVKDD